MMPPIVISVPLFWMMKCFFDTIPKELEESIFIDGGNRSTVIFRVALPLAFNGIIATALFLVYLTWTEFLYASILTNRFSATLPVVLSAFRQDRGILWGHGVKQWIIVMNWADEKEISGISWQDINSRITLLYSCLAISKNRKAP
ncbi:MAG TPA: carbohydrate ABC transporter permease [Spirochaetes bacterium]|nr:carbohydrate ABC transporter permease [Spirochaetota bacterium]